MREPIGPTMKMRANTAPAASDQSAIGILTMRPIPIPMPRKYPVKRYPLSLVSSAHIQKA